MTKPCLAFAAVGLLVGATFNTTAMTSIDIEEARIGAATQAMPEVVGRYQALVDSLTRQYSEQTDELLMTQMVARQGERLWQQAVRDVQSGGQDDRPLYWGRLAMKTLLKKQAPAFNIVPWQRNINLSAVEKSSRGFSNISFADDIQVKILLTGFDPFFLDRNIDQSNPSGLAALALDGYQFSVNGKKAQIQTVMIPVRFADFDEGMIESLLTPYYRDNSLDLIFTVSMGRDDFDLERFPGRNRSAAAPDNLNVLTGGNKEKPVAPMFNGKTLNGPEFVEYSLPVTAMQSVQGDVAKWKVNDNHSVTTLARGQFDATSLSELQNATSVEGSGGGYLSNEISYRAILLQQQFNSSIAVGHIHTPRVKSYDADIETNIVNQVKAMVESAAASL
ncbi:hypothetical protein FM038_003530 [Shewanella eurypsychrophilus]|uniref:Pyrrolidone-carboxylate peptidase n=1 Tax=Shewanella eurypsychrophilus TaxID=2593656 RepID=A0ABX6V1W1_9GAMM|nr:hypothetical protein FS418_05110 [Shewanella sp. YLB-09]QPG56599.1 hypothetical protein FM038_003530 [Shewanella eurypsychrophilus]